MSITTAPSTLPGSTRDRANIFQDLPLLDRSIRLTVMELRFCDKQIVNELVYRWCRILTRMSKNSIHRLAGPSDTAIGNFRKVLIVDMVGSINLIRLATVLKRDERRMRLIGIARGCKINSTYVTLCNLIGRYANTNSLELLVIYQDEFFILKTLSLLKEFIRCSKCQVLFVVPRLDRQEYDVLNLTSSNQTLKCDFKVNRRDVGPAPPEANVDSYQAYLNQIYFHRHSNVRPKPDRVEGELMEDGLYLSGSRPPNKLKEGGADSCQALLKKQKTFDNKT